MARKMELRDIIRESEALHVEIRVVLGEPIEEVDRPLAGYVIRYGDMFNGDGFQDRGEDVIRIDVAGPPLSVMRLERGKELTVLHVAGPRRHSSGEANGVHTRTQQPQKRHSPSKTCCLPG